MLKARFDEGFTLDEFVTVIDFKSEKWANDPDMAKYLRPETLFGTKMDRYLNEAKASQVKPRNNVPEWAKEEYRTEATAEELEELQKLKNEMTGEN